MTSFHHLHHHLHHHQQFISEKDQLQNEKKKIILPVSMASIFRFLTDSLGVFWAIYFMEKGLSGMEIGSIFAILTITALLITLPSGYISDRFKAKYLIMIGIGFTIIQFFFSSFTGSFLVLAVLFFIGGIGQNIHNTSIDSVFYKNLSPKIKDSEIGFYLSIRFLIGGSGVVVSGLALSLFSFTSVLKVIAVTLFFLILVSFRLPDSKPSPVSFKSYKKDLFRKEILVFIATIFLFSLHGGAELTSLGPYLKNNLNLSSPQIGLYSGIGIMSMAVSAFYASRKLQKKEISTFNLLTLGLYMSAIGMMLIAYPHPWISFLGRLTHVSGDSFILVVLYHDISSFFPGKHIGGDASLITLIVITGDFIGSLIFGPLGASIGYNYTILASSFATFLGLIFAYYQKKLMTAPVVETEKENI